MTKRLAFMFERTIPAPPGEVYAAWLDPQTPGTPWHEADKLLLNAQVDGFFYWRMGQTPHYGRFTALSPGSRIEHTWVSPNTLGEESVVTVTFQKKGSGTLMKLEHSNLPDHERAKSHEQGWNYFLEKFNPQR